MFSPRSEEIDDSLLTYLDMLIKKEMQRTMGPTADDDDLKNLVGVGKDTVNVLKMVKKRLEAEIRTAGRNDIRLLSKLLGEDSLEVGSEYRMQQLHVSCIRPRDDTLGYHSLYELIDCYSYTGIMLIAVEGAGAEKCV